MALIYSQGNDLVVNTRYLPSHLQDRLPEILPKIERETAGMEIGAAARVAANLVRRWADRHWGASPAQSHPVKVKGGYVAEVRFQRDGKYVRRSWSCVGYGSAEAAEAAVVQIPELSGIEELRVYMTEDAEMPHDDRRRTYLHEGGIAHG